jgi:hydrogenase expression/formation protein HypC
MRLLEISGTVARAEVGGVVREIRLDLLDDVKLEDYVIVHAGYAIEKLDEEEALKTIEMIEQII